jgi:hypothetical protein
MSKFPWNKLSKTTKIRITPRLFYGKYLYRVTISDRGMELVRNTWLSPTLEIAKGKLSKLTWVQTYQDARVDLLWSIKQLCQNATRLGIRSRREGSNIRFFTTDDTFLRNLLTNHPDIIDLITDICYANDKARELLTSTDIELRRTVPELRYKVIPKPGYYDKELLNNIRTQVNYRSSKELAASCFADTSICQSYAWLY